MEEIKVAVLNMNLEGTARPDGFGGNFYVSCWEVIN